VTTTLNPSGHDTSTSRTAHSGKRTQAGTTGTAFNE
jgi:hypothetical protein